MLIKCDDSICVVGVKSIEVKVETSVYPYRRQIDYQTKEIEAVRYCQVWIFC